MSYLNKLKGIRASRWMLLIAVSALIPLTAGCTFWEEGAGVWLYGYAYELAGMPARAFVGTGLLDFINTH